MDEVPSGAPQTATPSAGADTMSQSNHGEAYGVSMAPSGVREPGLAPGPRQENGSGVGAGRIISLIKPHYEVGKDELGEGGVLDAERAAAVTEEVLAAMPGLGVRVLGCVESPVLGGKKKGKGTGNREWLALLVPIGST